MRATLKTHNMVGNKLPAKKRVTCFSLPPRSRVAPRAEDAQPEHVINEATCNDNAVSTCEHDYVHETFKADPDTFRHDFDSSQASVWEQSQNDDLYNSAHDHEWNVSHNGE